VRCVDGTLRERGFIRGWEKVAGKERAMMRKGIFLKESVLPLGVDPGSGTVIGTGAGGPSNKNSVGEEMAVAAFREAVAAALKVSCRPLPLPVSMSVPMSSTKMPGFCISLQMCGKCVSFPSFRVFRRPTPAG